MLWLPDHMPSLKRWLQRAMTKPIFHSLRVAQSMDHYAQRQEHRTERCRYGSPERQRRRLYVETYPRRSAYGSIRTQKPTIREGRETSVA